MHAHGMIIAAQGRSNCLRLSLLSFGRIKGREKEKLGLETRRIRGRQGSRKGRLRSLSTDKSRESQCGSHTCRSWEAEEARGWPAWAKARPCLRWVRVSIGR